MHGKELEVFCLHAVARCDFTIYDLGLYVRESDC